MTHMKTTVVGSYPIPEWFKTNPSEEALLDALATVLRAQEDAGIDVISDGELSRWDAQRQAQVGMVERFVREMAGVQAEATCSQREAFRALPGNAYRPSPAGVITGPVDEGVLDLKRDWQMAQRQTHAPLKFTVTSPYMMAKLVRDQHYADLETLAMAFADVLARQLVGIDAAVVQVDEPNLPGSPDDSDIAARAINTVLQGVSGQKAVHVCFGNFGGQRIQTGSYERLIRFMNTLECHHLVLETTRRPAEELEMLAEVKPDMQFGMGVIDVKDLQAESAEQVAQRIETLAEQVGAERIAYVNPDCGLRMLPRPVADAKLRALVAGRNLFVGNK